MTMPMKKLIIILLLVLPCSSLLAQEDSTQVRKVLINDYSMIGVNYGVTFSNAIFNPKKPYKGWVIQPRYVSVMYTKYSKMFDYLPYFGLTVGFAYGTEGYTFTPDDTKGGEITQNVDGATWCSMDVLEVPAMMQIHVDADPIKLMANVGVYGGYRRSIERKGPEPLFDPEYSNKFRSYERQFDYGLQGGVGLAVMLDPIEIHFNCLCRWAWSNLYQPDYASKYYYRFAYPLDIIATVGIHFQLQKRNGKTTAALRKEAYDKVYGTSENTAGSNR